VSKAPPSPACCLTRQMQPLLRLLPTAAVDACASKRILQEQTRQTPPSSAAHITAAGRCCCMSGDAKLPAATAAADGTQARAQSTPRARCASKPGVKRSRCQQHTGLQRVRKSVRGQSKTTAKGKVMCQAWAWKRMPAIRVVSQAAYIEPAVSGGLLLPMGTSTTEALLVVHGGPTLRSASCTTALLSPLRNG
jgi:hypothetical protein